MLPNESHLRRMMGCPLCLRREQCLECRPEFALLARSLEHGNNVFRSLMERRVTQDKANVVRVRRHHLLHQRIETTTGFARGIEKFNDDDLRLHVAKRRRMHPNQAVSIAIDHLLRLLGRFSLVVHRCDGEHKQQ